MNEDTATYRWTSADVPDLHGRTAVVTGANTTDAPTSPLLESLG